MPIDSQTSKAIISLYIPGCNAIKIDLLKSINQDGRHSLVCGRTWKLTMTKNSHILESCLHHTGSEHYYIVN